MGKKKASDNGEVKKQQVCCCPYCDAEVTAKESPVCFPCGITLKYCSDCKVVVPQSAVKCPRCGKRVS